ncbi:glycoside hydrolase family 2 TIM barrel-domain containing protein [Clostridium tarantellae]|uniref:DUF4982 domain-containing protein n=1 Tax=Clostridium tarantellae TaxID=39493 RepID=A0A6I1MQQ1_9CLOT|nr:glycoside hydrolase family 2 TIM barrel-domain containing protein [Clostridium tarantellae]MPQ43201.1 DUF4982 domain-containing protein [Clostridium tarantellae]
MLIKRDKYSLGESTITNVISEQMELKLDLKISLNNKDILIGAMIYGNVLDSNNKPVKNAIIKLMDEKLQPLVHVYTDLNGKYMIENIPKSLSYNIIVVATGKSISKMHNLNILNNEIKNVNFTLEDDFNSVLGIISGKVLKNDSFNTTISGAVVFLYRDSKLIAITYTNSEGEFLLGELQASTYEVLISALGYVYYKTKIVLESGKISAIKAYLVDDGIGANAIISGIITDDNNLGVYTANVILYKVDLDNSLVPVAFTSTNTSGIYTFFNVPIGKYIVKSNKFEILSLNNSSMSMAQSNTLPNATNFSYDYNLVNGVLSNGAVIKDVAGYKVVGGIGGPSNGAITTTVNVSVAGNYNLIIHYIAVDITRKLKVDVNGKSIGSVYNLALTNGCTIEYAKRFTIIINLNKGANTIKFYGDGESYGPNLSTATLELIASANNTIPSYTIPSNTDIILNTTIPVYRYNAVNGKLSNGAKPDSGTNFAGWIGGPKDGETIINVDVPDDGTYNLEIEYLGAENNRNLKIDINGSNTGKIYNPMQTNGWNLEDSKMFNIFIKLMKGNNIIKFHGDGINYGPSLGKINLRLISKNKNNIYDLSKGILNNGAKINANTNFVSYIGGIQNGSVTLNINVLESGLYNCRIQYLSAEDNRTLKVDINNISIDKIYTVEKTNSWNISDCKILSFNINLNLGNNIIKFYGDGINNSPELRLITLVPVIKDNLPEIDIDISDDWKFNLGNIQGNEKVNFDDFAWRDIDIPHDWSIELDFNKDSLATHEGGYLDGGIAWYRKILILNEKIKNKKVLLNFEGVYMESKIYVNGIIAGENENGFCPFSFDITDKLNFNDSVNIIAVQVTNKQPSCRWYSGSGIYRKVSLTLLDYIYIEKYGTLITTPTLEEDLKNNKAVNVNIKLNIQNDKMTEQATTIKLSIYSPNNSLIKSYEKIENITGGLNKVNYDFYIENPVLWDIYLGNVYKVIIDIIVDGIVLNKYKTRFGFRYFNFDANKGFSLNGKYTKIKGVCMHDDSGALGVAENYDATLRQIRKLKNMGINAIRTSHNPRSQMFIELCEDEGILVKEEAFDCWKLSKKTYDYSRFFSKYAKKVLQTMINKDKNSPSVIIWSIGNEIYDTDKSEGVSIAKDLISWVKEIDNTRPVTIGENKPTSNFSNNVWNLLDLAGYNYAENYYDSHHNKYPNRKIFGSETSSAVRSRGIYLDPNNSNVIDWDNLQVSSYDNSIVSWGRSAEDSLKKDRDRQFVAGQFIWTGFDYIGEPTPFYKSYPAKSSYFGIVDTAGFEKDIYYLYQSQWTDTPMVHLLPHWNWTEGESIEVWAYSNVDTVELFLNDNSLGERKFENKTTNYGMNYLETANGKLHLTWTVLFKPGTLRAIAKKNGIIIAEDIVITAGTPYGLKLVADKNSIVANGKSLVFISVYIIDSKGVIVPTADNTIDFVVNGGTLVGVDNGNAISVERYKDIKRKAFNGKALAIIKSNEYSGNITLTVSSPGLNSQSISITKK